MRVRRFPLVVFALGASIAVAGNLGLKAVISPQSMQVYREAVEAGNKKKYPHALSRLEALLLDQPVTVAIDESTVPEGSDFADALPGALKIWEDALPDSPFREATLANRPQVVIKFVSSMRDLPQAQGDVQAQRDFYWNRRDYGFKLSATVRVMRRTGRRLLNREEASGVIAHELGHLLGLDDVDSREGLMGYFVAGDPKVRVEQEEIEAVGKFRQMLRDQITALRRSGNYPESTKAQTKALDKLAYKPSHSFASGGLVDTLRTACACQASPKR